MSFKACAENEERFYKPFAKDVNAAIELTKGRERYWIRNVASDIAERWDNIAPNSVLSYKWHVTRGHVTKDAAIVSCHGYPRPHQLNGKYYKIWNGQY